MDNENQERNIDEEIEEIEEDYKQTIKGMRIRYILIALILMCITFVVASEYTINYYGLNKISKVEYSNKGSDENIDAISENLKGFREVIDTYYLGEIDEENMLEETLKGYVNGLGDEYSEYFTAKEWEDFQAAALGNYVGIGIYMSQDKTGNVVVVSTIEGTPAAEAGLEEGDIFFEIDGENVVGFTSDQIAERVRGEAGTKVNLTMYRDGEYLDFEIVRKEIKIYHVKSEMLENNIGYIQLITFDENCATEIANAITDLQSKGAQNFILDLRNNTGGLLTEALDIADLFLDKGKTALITVDHNGNKEYSKMETKPIVPKGTKLVVLVNEYSASASEILTGALRDNDATEAVVGTVTYGKGVIQSVFSLTDGSALKLTVEEYFTPKEEKINKVGIKPDVEIELDDEQEGDEQLNKAIEILNNN